MYVCRTRKIFASLSSNPETRPDLQNLNDLIEEIRKFDEDAESTSCHPQALVADRTDRRWKCQLGRQVVEAPLLCKQTRSTLKYCYKNTFSKEHFSLTNTPNVEKKLHVPAALWTRQVAECVVYTT